MKLSELKVKIYADGADLKSIVRANENPLVKGFTTNPTLMRRAGVTDYELFARNLLEIVGSVKPVSFEVFSDDPHEMLQQALKISSWGKNVYVKIPIINTEGFNFYDLIEELGMNGVNVNVTAVIGLWQIDEVCRVLKPNVSSVISVFAGRIADTGMDAHALMKEAHQKMKFKNLPNTELLWASVREPLNIYQANEAGCDIITVPDEILKKAIAMQGRDLQEVCKETVQMFYNDALASGYTL